MDKKEKVLAVCSPVHYTSAPASKEKCAGCEVDLFLSESTLKAAQEQEPTYTKENLHIVCITCAIKIMSEHDKDELNFKPTTELQKREIKQGMVDILLENQKN